jgi:UDP-2,4-diacetamido-2,4,6-trideoxy-beta-L-altropyranose hydrolase
MNPGTLLIRADANAHIGSGHVMRCLALAQALQDAGGAAVLAAAELPSSTEKRLLGENVEVVRLEAEAGTEGDATEAATLGCARGVRWVVVDGEQFTSDYLAIVNKCGLKILWLDDFGNTPHNAADLILNQNPGVTRESYDWCREDHRLLVGTDYVLLRREFRLARGREEKPGAVQSLLLTFGGSDPDGLTDNVLPALGGDSPDLTITAVVGGGNPRLVALRRLAASLDVNLVEDAADMPGLMMRSDMAVIVGGGTLWELLYCGCAVLSYSRNSVQARVIAQLAKTGAVGDLGLVSEFDPGRLRAEVRRLAGAAAEREQMQSAGRRIVDGDGVLRVLRALNGE